MTTPVPFTCNADEARTLTEDIRRGVEKVHTLLVRSYEWKAWQALGYVSWRDYAMTEFGISKSRAYQLLDQARVIREIEAVASDSTIVESLDEGQARELAPIVRDHGPAAAAAVLAAVVESGKPTAAAIRTEAQAQGVAKVTQTTRTTEATKVEQVVDLDTGEILNDTVTSEAWEAEQGPSLDDALAADPEVRAANVRRRGTALLAYLHHPHPDATELAAIDGDLTEQLAARLSLLAAQYRNAVPRRLSVVKES